MSETPKGNKKDVVLRRDRIVVDMIQIKKLEKDFEREIQDYEIEACRFGEPIGLSDGNVFDEFTINTYVMPSDLWPRGADLLIFENAEKELKASMINFRAAIYE